MDHDTFKRVKRIVLDRQSAVFLNHRAKDQSLIEARKIVQGMGALEDEMKRLITEAKVLEAREE